MCELRTALPVGVGTWNPALWLGVRTTCTRHQPETCADRALSGTDAKQSEGLSPRLCREVKMTTTQPC